MCSLMHSALRIALVWLIIDDLFLGQGGDKWQWERREASPLAVQVLLNPPASIQRVDVKEKGKAPCAAVLNTVVTM